MKLNFLPLLAGLFFYITISYSQEEVKVNWMAAFSDYDSVKTNSPTIVEQTVVNDSTKVCDWYQKNCKELDGDTIEITHSDGLGHLRVSDFWYPSKKMIDSIIFYVKTVGLHEDEKGDKSEFSKKERKDFLKKLEYCQKHKIDFLYSLNQSNLFSSKTKDGKKILFGDALTYQSLKGLAEMVATKNLLVVQDYLVLNCWLIHDNHSDGNYTPIISEKEYEKIVMSRK
jgi:hypothetical protein